MSDFRYQLVFTEDCFAPYDMAPGSSFKESLIKFIYENPLHYGCTDKFFEALDKIDDYDIDKMIALFNEISCKTIAYVNTIIERIVPSISQESESVMPTTWYHFIFSNDAFYDIRCATSFKDAVWEMARYRGESTELLRKCLRGYEKNDVDGIVELFNHFAYTSIDKVYVISAVIYE